MPDEKEKETPKDKPKKDTTPKVLKASKTWHKSGDLAKAPKRAAVKVKAMCGGPKAEELKNTCYIRNGKVFNKAQDITANVREFQILKED